MSQHAYAESADLAREQRGLTTSEAARQCPANRLSGIDLKQKGDRVR